MSDARRARPAIAEMAGAYALPRKSGEMVFHAEWERRAFAIAVSLAERGHLEWREFQQQLIKSIAEAEHADPQNPTRGYYESWLASLEALLGKKQLLGDCTGLQLEHNTKDQCADSAHSWPSVPPSTKV